MPMEVEQLEEIETHKTIYELALRIVNVIEKEFSITVPKSECGYIMIHLLGKRMIKSAEEANLVVDEEMFETVNEMLKVADEEMNLELSQDLNLRLVLALHLIPLKAGISAAAIHGNKPRKNVDFFCFRRAVFGSNPFLCKLKGFFINQRFVCIREEVLLFLRVLFRLF